MTKDLSDLIPVTRVARMAEASAQMVRVWADTGRLPVARLANGMRLFRKSDVEHFVADRAERKAARAAKQETAGE